MTACKDVQDMNLGKKAVSAALAGTLAVGMVPALPLPPLPTMLPLMTVSKRWPSTLQPT